MKKIGKKLLCMFLALSLLFPANILTALADSVTEMKTVRVDPGEQNTSADNYFSYTAYSGKEWTVNNGSEAYIDLGTSDSRAEECYYELHFTGSKVQVFANKSHNHGKVEFTVDNSHEQVVDLYNSTRQDVAIVYEVSGLDEGAHTLKAVTQTTTTSGKIVNQVAYAMVTGQVELEMGDPVLGGTIENTDIQYTDDRYAQYSGKNVHEAKLTAWKNDKATSELVLYSKFNKVEDVTLSTGPLVGDNGAVIDASNVTAKFIRSAMAYNGGYIYGQYPAATEGNRSESADIIDSADPVEIPYNSLQPVWVEFTIPADAEAGNYTSTITVTGKDVAPVTFTYRVQVQGAVLPPVEERDSVFDIELWQYPYSSAEYYGMEPFSEEHLEAMRSSMLKYKEIGGHAITTSIVEDAWYIDAQRSGQTYSKNEIHYPSMVKWTKNADGTMSYDYSDFDAWVSFCKSLGIGDKIVIYSIAPWGNDCTYWVDGELVREKISAGTQRYTEVWTDFLTDLISHLEEKGWFDDAYIGIDERGFSDAAFQLIRSVTNSEGKYLKAAGAMDSMDANHRRLASYVDDLNVGDSAVENNRANFDLLLQERNEAGLRTTLYSCTGHQPGNFSLSSPVESYWTIVNAARRGTSGFLRWAYDAWVEDPLNDTTHSNFEAGDCFLIFPDEKDAEHPQSKSSVRLERMAEGVRDINKLKLMEKEQPSLKEDIDALYAKLTTVAGHSSNVMSLERAEALSDEMQAFKAGIGEITNKYLFLESGMQEVETAKTMEAGDVWRILPDASGMTFVSEDPKIASVGDTGVVTAKQGGNTVIHVRKADAGLDAEISVTVSRTSQMYISNKLPLYRLDDKYQSDVEKDQENAKGRYYLGQPDMVMLDDNRTLFTVFPVGHGVGEVVMKVSRDAGETWEEKTDIPKSWAHSYETPTLYKLNLTDGSTKLIMISGRPSSFGAATGGWDSSISTDNGETWTEYERFCETFEDGSRVDTVVAMASLIQLKDENGNLIDKWMGVFHDPSYVNYKTYLTFDEDGNQQWTTPVPYLSQYRDIESSYQICEVGMFRSPDGKRIVGLARSQSHNNPATMFYSDDEGETWSRPADLPGSLAGERHKGLYDPVSGKLVITFRAINYDKNGNNAFDGGSDWRCGDWEAWVGTYEDLMSLKDGDYRLILDEDWSNNTYSGDTGYTGMVVLPDGTFVMDSYGHWDESVSSSYSGDIRKDLCWIRQAKFRLADIEAEMDILDGSEQQLRAMVEQACVLTAADASAYTKESWNAFWTALDAAMTAQNDTPSKLADVSAPMNALRQAMLGLKPISEEELVKAEEEKQTLLQQSESAILEGFAYSEDALKEFQNALAWVNNLSNVADTVQIKAATENLKSAIAKLQKEYAQGQAAPRAELQKTIDSASTQIDQSKYTYGAKELQDYQAALQAARELANNPSATAQQLSEAKKKLEAAVSALQKTATPVKQPETPVKVGDIKDDGKYNYRITSTDAKTVALSGLKKKSLSKITIYSTVKLGGISYKVTSVADKAFKGNKKITAVTGGKNLTKIGKNAFAGCTKLKTVSLIGKKLKEIGASAFSGDKALKKITLKTTALKKVGSKAFKGIQKKAVIKVPKKKLTAYKKLLKGKGQKSTVKITK